MQAFFHQAMWFWEYSHTPKFLPTNYSKLNFILTFYRLVVFLHIVQIGGPLGSWILISGLQSGEDYLMAKTSTKSLSLVILMLLLIVFPALSGTWISKGRILRQHSTAGSESSMMRLHRMKTGVGRRKGPPSLSKKEPNGDREFHDAAHEVPSGPNPESNWSW